MTMPIRYFYRKEVEDNIERIFTVAYTHDIETGLTQYGGAVFRHAVGDNRETFRKGPHRETAARRLQVRPVSLIIKRDNFSDVESSIRQSIREVGVSGKRNK